MGLFKIRRMRLARFRPSEGAGRRIGALVAFEIGHQLRLPGFWLATGLLFITGMALMSSDTLFGSAVLARNAPAELAKAVIVLNTLFLFGVVAMAADAALRDSASGFEPLIRSTPLTRAERIIGRFLGLQAASLTAFTLSTCGILLGPVMPWIDPRSVGPFYWPQIAQVWLVIGAPTVIALTSVCFALAVTLRSAAASYVAVISSLLLVAALPKMLERLHQKGLMLAALVEPFGLLGFTKDTLLWSVAQKATHGVPLGGLLMLNRASVLLASAGLLLLAIWVERRGDDARMRRAPANPEPPAARSPMDWRDIRPTPGAGLILLQFLVRLQLEARAILLRPSLLVLTPLIQAIAISQMWTANYAGEMPSLPATRVLISPLIGSFAILALLVSIFFGGEAFWRERDRRVADLIDATPAKDIIFMSAKVCAVICVILALAAISVASAMAVQMAKGYSDPHPDQYLTLFLLPSLQALAFPVTVSMASAVLSPNRVIGWMIPLLMLGGLYAAEHVGFSHPLFDFGEIPGAPLSEMNPQAGDSTARAWISLYWFLWSALTLLVTWLFWPRGQLRSLQSRLHQARLRLHGPVAWIACALVLVLVLTIVGTGGWIFVNTVIWNPFMPKAAVEAEMARLEREKTPYLRAPAPVIVDTRIQVILSPRIPKLEASGRLTLQNRTGRPISRFYVDLPGVMTVARAHVDGARLVAERDGLLTFAMDAPLAPGARTGLDFQSLLAPRGFAAGGAPNEVTRNGSFVRSDLFIPTIGVNSNVFLRDRIVRRRQKLPESLQALEPTDPRAGERNYVRADWTTADITVTTDADQTPLAPGRLASDVVKNGRRTSRFLSDRPILGWYSIQSARYAVRRVRKGDVDIAVYFHPGHDRNVDRMLTALSEGLDIYQREFGPYQFSYLRIVEFPAYGDYAQAFAGTIPFSENAGFIADLRDPRLFDQVTHITLHELAHQWWAHQVVGGDARGARLMSEGMAEYSATMALRRIQGPHAANLALINANIAYRKGRSNRRDVEPALFRENGETYVAYKKADMSLSMVSQALGEDRFHRVMRRFLRDHAFRGPPYPTSIDFVDRIGAELGPERWTQMKYLFYQASPYSYPIYKENAGDERR